MLDLSLPKKAAPSGMEIMLKSMGLGAVIEAAQQLANAGTIEKILKFADNLEELNGRLGRIECLLIAGSGPGDGGLERDAEGSSTLELGASLRRLRDGRDAGNAPDHGPGGDFPADREPGTGEV